MVKIGILRHKITIQQTTQTQGDYGNTVDTWANIGTNPTPWAEIIPVSGNENFIADQVWPDATHRIRIRARNDLNTKMKIIATIHGNSRTYDILYIRNVEEKNIMTEMICRESPA